MLHLRRKHILGGKAADVQPQSSRTHRVSKMTGKRTLHVPGSVVSFSPFCDPYGLLAQKTTLSVVRKASPVARKRPTVGTVTCRARRIQHAEGAGVARHGRPIRREVREEIIEDDRRQPYRRYVVYCDVGIASGTRALPAEQRK